MDQFEYVMVLVSIIIGLGIAHVLFGIGGIIDRLASKRRRLELSLAHGAWLGQTFVWMVLFWWWEFRFSELQTQWTLGIYFFLVLYSVALFLLAVILVPRTWDGVDSLNEYFLERRVWFYSVFLAASGLDIVDSFLKGGWQYVVDPGGVGPWTWSYWLLALLVGVVGLVSNKIRHHALIGVVFLLWQVASGFGSLPSLGF